MSSEILSEEIDGVALLTLNRPARLNALAEKQLLELKSLLDAIGQRRDVRVVILRGAGDRAFSVGMDLKERRNLSPQDKWKQATALRDVCAQLWSLPQPVIAAISGWCLGGGFELALNCDMRVADKSAVFAWPEMQLGAFPGGTAAVILPRIAGRAAAKDLFFTARRIGAIEARELSIVDRIAEEKSAVDTALELAATITRNTSPLGVAAAKRMLNHTGDMSIGDAMAMNEVLRAPLDATKDYEEGIAAFFEKRAPVWRGE